VGVFCEHSVYQLLATATSPVLWKSQVTSEVVSASEVERYQQLKRTSNACLAGEIL